MLDHLCSYWGLTCHLSNVDLMITLGKHLWMTAKKSCSFYSFLFRTVCQFSHFLEYVIYCKISVNVLLAEEKQIINLKLLFVTFALSGRHGRNITTRMDDSNFRKVVLASMVKEWMIFISNWVLNMMFYHILVNLKPCPCIPDPGGY